MNYNIPVRLKKLHKRNVDLLDAIKDKGIPAPYDCLYAGQLSNYLNEKETSPKSELVLAEADKIVTGWEHENA